MCGIAGFCLSREEHVNAKKLSMALLNQIVARGEDSTGASWVQSDRASKKATIAVSKAPVPAYNFEPYLDKMPIGVRRAILHTRWATKGTPENNLNNHPIVSGKIVGVHNGTIGNDDNVFRYLKEARQAQVDSEAIFALLNRTKYSPADVLRSLSGRVAIAWLDARDKRDLHLARVEGSPLAIGQTEKGSLVFASTMPLLVNACEDSKLHLTWAEEIEPVTYLRVRDGEIVDLQSIGKSLKEIA